MAETTTRKKKTPTVSETPAEVRAKHQINPKNVETGHLMAIVHFVKVKSKNYDGTILQLDNLGAGPKEFQVSGRALVEDMFSADVFEEEKEVTSTEIIKLFISSFNRPFTINWDKEDGENRTLRGRYISHEDLKGRSYVEDFDAADGRPRLVDHRTIHWFICEGVKYKTKTRK